MINIQRLLLFERSGNDEPRGIGSILYFDDLQGLAVSSIPLDPALGKTYLFSADGTRNNLVEIAEALPYPIKGPDVAPHAYFLRRRR